MKELADSRAGTKRLCWRFPYRPWLTSLPVASALVGLGVYIDALSFLSFSEGTLLQLFTSGLYAIARVPQLPSADRRKQFSTFHEK